MYIKIIYAGLPVTAVPVSVPVSVSVSEFSAASRLKMLFIKVEHKTLQLSPSGWTNECCNRHLHTVRWSLKTHIYI